jgi:hypothetical protein
MDKEVHMETIYAEITNNIVTNIAVCEDEAFARQMGWILLPDGFGIGDSYIDGVFSKAVVEE